MLMITISKSKVPCDTKDKICYTNNIYYVNDSIYKYNESQNYDITTSQNYDIMNPRTEMKYWEVIEKYGQDGDHILNYIGPLRTAIELIKKSI